MDQLFSEEEFKMDLDLIIYSRFLHPDVFFCVSHTGGGVRTEVVVTTVCATVCIHTAVARTCSLCRADMAHTHGSR